MKQSPRVARPGDVCILLEPDVNEIPRLRWLQRELQTSFGGRMQERVHFTCQRFELPDAGQLPPVVKQFVSAFHPRLIGLTGTPEQIAIIPHDQGAEAVAEELKRWVK